MKGVVQWYDVKKGFGFITGEDKNNYFVHYSALPEDLRLFENTPVEFETIRTHKGLQAMEVRLGR